ncbi:MAG: glycosyltransferase family 2 protein [Sphingomonadaceae bacterium]|nr:glycosyltransferase family 2 protein [Sphingomonadaceae bacterium]
MLGSLARAPSAGLRLWAARKAADRALHAAALRGAADDPYVLARLGLHPLALEHDAHDEAAAFGQLLAKTTLGRIGALREAGPLDSKKSLLLARALAPHAPSAALKYLADEDRCARAACLIAAGRLSDRSLLRPDEEVDAESSAILAHIAAKRGDALAARKHINRIFEWSALSEPLDLDDEPVTLDAFQRRVLLPRDGPKVSVIVPFHDAADTLETAVCSLTGQSWRDLEIVLIDDRSTDDGAALAARLAADDPRIRPITNDRAPGAYGARNAGVDVATGDYVTFLDADDWSPAERIARQMDSLAKGGTISIANHIRIDEGGAPVAPRVFPLVRMVPITMLLQREALIAAGPFEEVETGADSEMFARLEMLHGKSEVRRDRAVLLVARWRTGSLSEAREGGVFGGERLAYRSDWMFRHAGLEPPALASSAQHTQVTLNSGEGTRN